VLVLRSVREVVDVAFTRPGKALLGITALATDRLSGHINVKWIADDKLVPVFDGATWDIQFSRNRSWVTLAELTQPVISGDGNGGGPFTVERYEGLSPSRIDVGLFYEWAEWCDQQVPSGKPSPNHLEDRMTCDIIVDWLTDVWSLAYELAQIGRMYPYWQGNILTGWIDKEVTGDPFDLITFDNVMVKSWKNSWSGFGVIAGSVEVFYKDALLGYERKGLPLSNESAGRYTRIVAVEGSGATSCALATRIGNHALTRNKLIKNVNSVRMYKDALRYRLGKVVRLQSNVPNWGKTYRVIKSEANNTCELDRVIDAVENDIVYVRSYDEANKKVDISSYTVDSCTGKVLTIKETWDVTPIKNNIVAIGVAGAIKLRRITKMRHAVDNYFDVTFETYDADLFESDDIVPQIENPDYAWPQPPSDLAAPASQQWVIDTIDQLLRPSPNIDCPWISNCDWNNNTPDAGHISWSKRNADEPILFRYRGVTYQITPDSTNMEFIYWDPAFTDQFRKTNDAATAYVVGKWVMCRNKAGVAYPATPMQLTHAGILQAGTITAALAQIADAAITTAKIANLAVVTGKIKNLAVETLKIKDNAVTLLVGAYTAGHEEHWDTNWHLAQTVAITTIGQPVALMSSVQWYGDHISGVDIRGRRDGDIVFEEHITSLASFGNPFSMIMVDEPDAGAHVYDLEIRNTPGTGATWLGFRHRSLVTEEIKK